MAEKRCCNKRNVLYVWVRTIHVTQEKEVDRIHIYEWISWAENIKNLEIVPAEIKLKIKSMFLCLTLL
jgi:hypothetical protein